MNGVKLLGLEARGCFDFFWDQANTDSNSPGCGLIVDITDQPDVASISPAVGKVRVL